MAHKPLIGGTAYEIVGGKDLIGGTVYEKDHGKTLVGGTVYEVGFAKMVTITLLGSVSSWAINANHVVHNGTTYTSLGTFEAAVGDTITVHAGGAATASSIYLNGTQVASGIHCDYQYIVGGNATIEVKTSGTSYMDSKYLVYITEE